MLTEKSERDDAEEVLDRIIKTKRPPKLDKVETETPEAESEKADHQEPTEAEEPEEKPAKRHQIHPGSMVQPEQDNQRMLKWRRELGPDKRTYRDD